MDQWGLTERWIHIRLWIVVPLKLKPVVGLFSSNGTVADILRVMTLIGGLS